MGLHDVFAAHRPALVRFLRARGAADEAEDLAQDVWLKIGAAPSGPVDDPLAYLFRMADNLMIDRHRARVRRERREESWSEATCGGEAGWADGPLPERSLAARQRLATVGERLRALGPRTETVFLRFRVDGVGQRQIAAEQGISLSAVEKHLQKAYRALIALQAEEGTEMGGSRRPAGDGRRDG